MRQRSARVVLTSDVIAVVACGGTGYEAVVMCLPCVYSYLRATVSLFVLYPPCADVRRRARLRVDVRCHAAGAAGHLRDRLVQHAVL